MAFISLINHSARQLKLLAKQQYILKRTAITGLEWTERCKRIDVLDSHISYYDSQSAHDDTVVFLHGNPTSSYLWRNVIPHVEGIARCIAPDLIGMGQSGKSGNGSYRFIDHFKYLSAWFDLLDLHHPITIVCHDWGSGLGFHWCHKNSHSVKALVHMESVVAPFKSLDEWPEFARSMLREIRSDAGEEMILNKNFFVERVLQMGIIRELSKEEFEAYKMPYKEKGESRRPTLTWPREIPIESEGPQDVINIVASYGEFLSKSTIPKLFIEADPGFLSETKFKHVSLQWPNTKVVKVKGLHFLQEDSPDDIGLAIQHFIKSM